MKMSKIRMGFKFSEEAKQKMRKPKNHGKKVSKALKGKPKPEGFGYKIGLKLKGKKQPEGTGEKKSKALKGKPKYKGFGKLISIVRSKPIIQYDLNMNPIKEWKSVKEATQIFNPGDRGDNIGMCCRGKSKTSFGFIWKYK